MTSVLTLKVQFPSLRYVGSWNGFRTSGKSCIKVFIYQELLTLAVQNTNIFQKEIYTQTLDS